MADVVKAIELLMLDAPTQEQWRALAEATGGVLHEGRTKYGTSVTIPNSFFEEAFDAPAADVLGVLFRRPR